MISIICHKQVLQLSNNVFLQFDVIRQSDLVLLRFESSPLIHSRWNSLTDSNLDAMVLVDESFLSKMMNVRSSSRCHILKPLEGLPIMVQCALTSGVMRSARPSPEGGNFFFFICLDTTRSQNEFCTHHQCQKVSRPKRESVRSKPICEPA